MNPQDYGGSQHRPRFIFMAVHPDATCPVPCPEPTTPARDVHVSTILDPPELVDWGNLQSAQQFVPTGVRHTLGYTGPKREFVTGVGGIGNSSYSTDGAACAMKLFDRPDSPGGWCQVYNDDRRGYDCHRWPSIDEGCRMARFPPASTDDRSRVMLGAGVDGHVLSALATTLAAFVVEPAVSIEPTTCSYSATFESTPHQLRHARFCHAGAPSSLEI